MYVGFESVGDLLKGELTRNGFLGEVLLFESAYFLIGSESEVIRQFLPVESYIKMSQNMIKTLESMREKCTEKRKIHQLTKEAYISLIPRFAELMTNKLYILEKYFPNEFLISYSKELFLQVSKIILPQI
ncbi:hypothetical protein C5B42_05110 [Candidatus Cerribacteria bacterium 'Amazon FNV 2010 28 9']|uniref:Uncharacterized protein n=1 Tax=Candidatus Cerribacteria bacterium 'Amazon FNV 2010 28 9' TaxID=2081795 RepID=A0A317JNT0_9BACT|nr:MAG: hypothetical protein C5B42_05110 [Candidatus Cerribacteria bacterium 'Amazon FNV 2010 28 9']